jgi:hypothetical protein
MRAARVTLLLAATACSPPTSRADAGPFTWTGGSLLPAPSGDELVAVAVEPAGELTVCGPLDSGAAPFTLSRWDGARWSALPVPQGDCRSLFAPANGTLWLGSFRAAFRLTDGQWTRFSLGDNREVTGIWGPSPDAVWFTGENYCGYFDGSAFTFKGDFDCAMGSSLWGTSVDDLWGLMALDVPENVAHHWDGTQVDRTVTFPVWMRAIWGSSPDDFWAVGTGGAIQHFDGATWSAQVSPTSQTLLAVWGTSRNDVWAVGEGGTLIHSDGGKFVALSSPTSSSLNAISGAGAAVFAVGAKGTVVRLR